MLAFGGLLICAAVLALAALLVVFRSPDRPRWTYAPGVEELIALAVVAVMAFGLGCLGAGAIRAYEAGPSLLDLGLLAAVLLMSGWIWRRLAVRQRLRALEARPAPAAPDRVAPAKAPVGGMKPRGTQPIPGEPPPDPSKPTRRAA